MKQRNLLKFAIFIGLMLFVPISFLVRFFTRNRRCLERAVEQISERIRIPKEVQGQLGFKATISQDGRMVAVAGNPVMDGRLFGKNSNESVPNRDFAMMHTLRAQFYVSEAPFKDFRFLWKSRNTSFASSIAISPTSNGRLAALVYEFPFDHLDSFEESVELFEKDERARLLYEENVKKGYDANIYLIDTETGNSEKLVTMFTNNLPAVAFIHLVNERALTWDSTGNLLISHDYEYVFSIDMSGQKKNIFSLENCGVFSSLFCDADNKLSMVLIEKGKGKHASYDGHSFLLQIDMNGNILKKESFSCPAGYYYEENNITFVAKNKIVFFTMSENSARLHELSRPLERSLSGNKSNFFYSLNDVMYYYATYGIFPETGEVLFAQKRLLNGTPLSEANKAVPWVELRRFSSNSIENL